MLLAAALAFGLAGLASFLITPITARLARRLGILDRPGAGHKLHAAETPYLGGVAIVTGMAAATIVLLVAVSGVTFGRVITGTALAVGLGVIGLIDDIRPTARSLRLLVQLGAAVAAWFAGFQVTATSWEPANLALTIIWIVGITNAFNLLDNMDGLTAGLAALAASAFAVMGILEDLPTLSVVSASVAGSALGFLVHNRHPAKIFMGDAGSMFLGFLLALIGIKLEFQNLIEVTFLVPVVVLGLPIFDTTLVVLSRLRAGRSPFLGATDHTSHRLVRIGLPVPAAVGLLYWTGACLGWLGLIISRANVQVGWMLLAFVVAMAIFLGLYLWRVPGYQSPKDLPEEALEADPDAIVAVKREQVR